MALATIALRLWQSPHGGQDAWVIWNARARAIFRAGDAWRDDIYRVVIGHVHLDYPLLLPVSVVRAWMYGGGETTLAPALIALLFTAATIGLLVATVAALCGRAHAYTAGLVLLGYTFFVLHANSEQAEAPLIYFYLATLVPPRLSRSTRSGGTPLSHTRGRGGGVCRMDQERGIAVCGGRGARPFRRRDARTKPWCLRSRDALAGGRSSCLSPQSSCISRRSSRLRTYGSRT